MRLAMDADRDRNRAPNAAAGVSPEDYARRMQSGDAKAVEVVRQRVRRILAFKGLRIPRQDRDDLEQEILAALWQAIKRSDFDFGAGFWGFVEVVTSRRCIDWLRAKKETYSIEENLRDTGKSPVERVLEDERAKIASQVLGALDPQCRKIVSMRLHEGMPYRQIARSLRKSEGAVRVQMYRCIRAARDILNRIDPEACLGSGEGGPDGPS
jgi:RNA polymerase sigma factor (sigma-70 family)